MNAKWMFDARKIPDEVMNYLRRIAVRAVEEKGYSPETVADFLNISRSCIYDWLHKYHEQGEEALDTKMAPGAPLIMTPEIDEWLRKTILTSTPEAYGYDTVLWTLKILVDLLDKQFGICVSDAAIALHLHAMKLSCQVPCYQARQQEPRKVDHFLNYKFPLIQRVAEKIGADIAFEDESGIGIRTRSGRTWGQVNKTPVVTVNQQRGSYNVLSAVTATGELDFDIEEAPINGKRYIEFLEKLLKGRTHPLIVIADNASFHRSKEVRDFVRSHRHQIRLFFLPPYSPEMNPDEQVWNEIKHRHLEKEPIKNKSDLNRRIDFLLRVLKEKAEKVRSFFRLPNTRYAGIPEPA
jgi:transposase